MQQSIETYNFSGKKAIIRVDFNVPLDASFAVTDSTRIRAAIPTIKKVLDGGGAVILMSHLGRPKGVTEKFSLKHIIPTIEQLLNTTVHFADDCQNADSAAKELKMGEVLLLENLRFYAEEEGKARVDADASDAEKATAKAAVKESQKGFVKKLASYADCYINDAFGTAHRAHASTALIAEYFPNDKMFGYIMENELKAIDSVLQNAQKPFTAILGGSKVSTKITIIESLMEKVDNLILGGGMTYTFKAAQGGNVGNSICEKDQFETALRILKAAQDTGVNIVLASDAACGDNFSDDCNKATYPANEIPEGWEGMDIGSDSVATFTDVIKNSKTILWNGPVGVFEMPSFAKGSRAIGEAIVEATKNGAFSLVGGGDSVACVNQFGMADKVSYVSTGGGALLEYMEGIELPGVAAIKK